MLKANFAAFVILAAFLSVVPYAQAQGPTWTVETIDALQTTAMGFTLNTGADFTQTYPAIAVRDSTTNFPVFYTKESGSWNKYTIAAVAATVSTVMVFQDQADATHWEAFFFDGANLQVYESADGGQTWASLATVSLGACSSPSGKFYVSGSTIAGQGCDGGVGQLRAIRSDDSGATWASPLMTTCKHSNNGDKLQFFGGATWKSVGFNGAADFSVEVSSDDCATASLFDLDTSTSLEPGQISPTGKGTAWVCPQAAASRAICWNPLDATPSSTETQTLVAAADVVDTIAQVAYTESGDFGAFIFGTGGAGTVGQHELVLTADGGTTWASHELPSSVDGVSSQFTLSIVGEELWFYYMEESTGDLKAAHADFSITASETPDAPAGLSALVTVAGTNSEIELRWTVSANDPDQDQGAFTYTVFLDGVDVGDDGVSSQDADGQRFNLVVYGDTTPGPTTFFIKATNALNGLTSPASCSVQVDVSVLNSFDTCGTIAGLGSVAHTTTTDTGAGLLGFCSDLMGDSDASLFLCGLIFVVFAFMAMAGGYAAITGSTGIGPTIAGSVAGFGMMVFNVFAGIWGIVWAIVLIILVAAIITAVVKRFTGASGGAPSGE